MNERLLLLCEADDDLQDVLALDTRGLLRRIYCYYLLSDSLILHPAYVWQSKTTNELVFGPLSQLLVPPNARMLLGDSGTVTEYIADRIDRLEPQKLNLDTNEYRQYERWGRELKEGALKLDRIFSGGKVISLRESRDKKFRRLLANDISVNIDPNSLYTQIFGYIKTQALHIEIENVVQRLKEFVKSFFLVSMETFTNYVDTGVGLRGLALSLSFRKRILNLYYHANIDDEIFASGLQVLADRIIDPFDPDVFWAVFSKLFGKEAAKVLSTGTEPTLIRALLEIRNNETWLRYQSIYFTILEQIEESLWQNVNLITHKIRSEAGYSGTLVLRRIWDRHKLSLAGTVFGGLSILGGSPILLPFGVVSVSISLYQLLRDILPSFLYNYYNSYLTRLRYLVDGEVQKILLQQ